MIRFQTLKAWKFTCVTVIICELVFLLETRNKKRFRNMKGHKVMSSEISRLPLWQNRVTVCTSKTSVWRWCFYETVVFVNISQEEGKEWSTVVTDACFPVSTRPCFKLFTMKSTKRWIWMFMWLWLNAWMWFMWTLLLPVMKEKRRKQHRARGLISFCHLCISHLLSQHPCRLYLVFILRAFASTETTMVRG